jgi:hypothetical protein
LLANGSGPSLQASNLTDNLKSRGVQTASSSLKTLYDLNGAVGGPIKQDKLWFYASSRYFTNEYYLASKYYPTDVTAVTRTNDLGRQAYAGTYTYDNNGRSRGRSRRSRNSPPSTPTSTKWIRTGS